MKFPSILFLAMTHFFYLELCDQPPSLAFITSAPNDGSAERPGFSREHSEAEGKICENASTSNYVALRHTSIAYRVAFQPLEFVDSG